MSYQNASSIQRSLFVDWVLHVLGMLQSFISCCHIGIFSRHVLVSCQRGFSEKQWSIVSSALRRAVSLCALPLRQLILLFHESGDSFYGDVGHVKVAARRDSNVDEVTRIRQLSRQV